MSNVLILPRAPELPAYDDMYVTVGIRSLRSLQIIDSSWSKTSFRISSRMDINNSKTRLAHVRRHAQINENPSNRSLYSSSFVVRRYLRPGKQQIMLLEYTKSHAGMTSYLLPVFIRTLTQLLTPKSTGETFSFLFWSHGCQFHGRSWSIELFFCDTHGPWFTYLAITGILNHKVSFFSHFLFISHITGRQKENVLVDIAVLGYCGDDISTQKRAHTQTKAHTHTLKLNCHAAKFIISKIQKTKKL